MRPSLPETASEVIAPVEHHAQAEGPHGTKVHRGAPLGIVTLLPRGKSTPKKSCNITDELWLVIFWLLFGIARRQPYSQRADADADRQAHGHRPQRFMLDTMGRIVN